MAKNLGRTSLLLASGTLISRLLGFVKAIVLAQTIGLVGSASADAFANANSLPTNIYGLIAGGLLNAVLVPQIVRATKNADGGQKYVNRLITLAIVVLGGMTVVITLAAPLIAWLYGLTLNEEQLGLVVAFAYWCLPQVFFYALYAVISEVLNARSIFIPFAWAPVLNNIISLVGLFVFSQVFGADPTGARPISDWSPEMIAMLGGFTTLGVVTQALVLFIFLPRAGFRYRPDFRFRGTGLGRIGSLASWSLGMVIVVQIVSWIEILALNVAFGQAVSLAALQNANMIFLLPHAIITVSLTTMMFTSMSERATERDIPAVIQEFSRGARTITMFMVFATVALMVMAPPFSRIFSASDEGVSQLAIALIATLVGLVGFSLFYFANRVNFAFEDTRSVFLIYAVTAPIQIGCAFLAVTVLPVEWLAVGITFFTQLITYLRLAIQLQLIRKRILGRLDGARIARSTVRFAIGTIPTAAVGVVIVMALGGYVEGGWARSGLVAAFITCAVSGVAMATVYFAVMWALRAPEFNSFFAPVLRAFTTAPGRHQAGRHRHAADAAYADQHASEYGTLLDPDIVTAEVAEEVRASSAGMVSGDAEMAAVASHNTTQSLSRRELHDYAQRRRAQQIREYEQRREADDEPLI